MSDAWFAYAIAPDGDTADGCHPDEAGALQAYLKGQITTKQAAEAITKPIATSNDPGGDLHRLWGLLADALMELPEPAMYQLLDLISAIESLPAPDLSAVPQENLPAHGTLWRGLPGFGHQWSDESPSLYCWSEGTGRVSALGEGQDVFVTQSIRRAEVEAWLVRRGLAGLEIGWGYECVTDALERSKSDLNTEVPKACAWLITLGDRFQEGADNLEGCWALERSGDLWKGEDQKRMTKERWDFWIQRLKEIADNDAVSSRAREAARQCVSKI
ncbi:ATG16-domain-containing protein [Apiospora aurea]|uniref:ATG16-domain-containing protein n=1 Tax=Apiospora aurea TaxID=335848 RepID=A0ABR1QZH5_9PEZI